MKVLNLYAGIGGNRKLWPKYCEVTAVEFNPEIANVYHHFFPDDRVIVADAHRFILDHYKEYDFIWSSRPCQTHSSFRHNICVRFRGTPPVYPDFGLYEEIVFLKHNAVGGFVVENVKPYYEPLIAPTAELQRHLFWSNFDIAPKDFPGDRIRYVQIPQLQAMHGFNLDGFRLPNKRQILRNCVAPEVGLYVLEQFIQGGMKWRIADLAGRR